MNRLLKGMYYGPTSAQDGLFGLRCDQTPPEPLLHNAGWYNANGERLGWGSLTAIDLRKIASALTQREAFVVLTEIDTFWENAPWNDSYRDILEPTEGLVDAPGPAYIARKCCFVVIKDRVMLVNRDQALDLTRVRQSYHAFVGGLLCEVINPAAAWQLIAERSCREAEVLDIAAHQDMIMNDEDVILLSE